MDGGNSFEMPVLSLVVIIFGLFSLDLFCSGAVCRGIISESVGMSSSIKLPDHYNVSKWNLIMLSDSQAAIKALSSNVMNSKTVYC